MFFLLALAVFFSLVLIGCVIKYCDSFGDGESRWARRGLLAFVATLVTAIAATLQS